MSTTTKSIGGDWVEHEIGDSLWIHHKDASVNVTVKKPNPNYSIDVLEILSEIIGMKITDFIMSSDQYPNEKKQEHFSKVLKNVDKITFDNVFRKQ